MQQSPKAALYIRVSTEEQAEEGQSASAQAETLKQYCGAYGIEVFELYQDLGYSGKRLADRPGLARLLEDCGRGCFSLVLVWKISRLSRNLKDLLYLIDIFETCNVHFTSCSERFDTSTPVGRMTLQLLGSIAEFERNTIVENVKLGLAEFARNGGKSTTVLGYDNIGKRLVVNEAEAKLVRLIFSLYAEAGLSSSAIAEYLNSLGCKTKRGNAFRGGGIAYILHNPVYVGINRHRINRENPYSVQGQHTAIIDPELWSRSQEALPAQGTKKLERQSSGTPDFKVSCTKCRRPMKIFYTEARGKKYVYYRCGCCSNYVNVRKLEGAVCKAAARAIEDKSLQGRIYELLEGKASVCGPSMAEASAVETEIKRLKKSRTRYLSLFEGYKLADTQTFIDRIAEIESRLTALEARKLELGRAALVSCPGTIPAGYFERLTEDISAFRPETAAKLSAALVKSIEAYGDDIKVVLYL
ncbi:MAG TPA: recombinase family protein [Clostridia bacterium]|nr:recombinase family protein [Clostridia bacterium]